MCISNHGINSTSDSYDSMIRWLIPVILEAFDVILNHGWQFVLTLVSLYGVSSLYHCEMESCVEVNFSEFIVTLLDRKGVMPQWDNWNCGKFINWFNLGQCEWNKYSMRALQAYTYLGSPTLVGSSMGKIAAMVNKELSHITTTVYYSAATVDIHQLICLIVPLSCHREWNSWSTGTGVLL